MSYLSAKNLHYSISGRTLLDAVNFTLKAGERVGLIGSNGSGKTTLLRILCGELEPYAGEVHRQRNLSIGFLRQQPHLEPDHSIRQVLNTALEEFHQLEEELSQINQELGEADEQQDLATLLRQQEDLQSRLVAAQGWTAERRMSRIAGRLGIHDLEVKIATLSLGWQKRVALTRILLAQPDVLFLDEPTNHLDAETIELLEGIIGAYRGSVLLITHDRYLLDKVVDRVVEIESAKLQLYQGAYVDYLREKALRFENLQRQHNKRLKLIKSEEEFLKRTPQGRRGKSEARKEKLTQLKNIAPPLISGHVNFNFIPDGNLGNTILNTVDLGKSFADKKLFKELNLSLERGERIGIIGPNGCGKSTFLKILIGQLQPDSGYIEQGKRTKIAYFDQEREILDSSDSVYDAVNGASDYVRFAMRRKHIVSYLKDFLFAQEDLQRLVSSLSGGEKVRLGIAKLLLGGANLLLFDEPTNDLDLATIQVLESALVDFAGCSLIVTHDRFFLNRVATSILAFEADGNITKYYGNYNIYQRLKSAEERENDKSESKKKKAATGKSKKMFGYNQQQELIMVEDRIGELEKELKAMEAQLSDPDIYTTDSRQAGEINLNYKSDRKKLAELYDRWDELSRLQEKEKNKT